MLCSKCGHELKPNAKFCSSCGQKTQTLDFELSQAGGIQIIKILSNKLDISNHEDFQNLVWKATESGDFLIAVDMKNMQFIDSLAVGTLVGLNDELRTRGGHIILSSVNQNIRKVLEISGFLNMFEIFPDLEGVFKKFSKMDSTPGKAPRNP